MSERPNISVHLIMQLAHNRFRKRYQDAPLGLATLFAVPLLTLLLLSLVFGTILSVRWQLGDATNYPIILFSGLLVHFFVAETLVQGPNMCREFASLIKQTSIPTPALAWVVVADQLLMLLITTVVFAAVLLWLGLFTPWVFVAVGYLIICLVPLGLGITWLTATLGMAWPSLPALTGPLASALLLLSPVLYPLERLPDTWQAWFWLNPSTAVVETFRAMVFSGEMPSPALLGWTVGLFLAFSCLSYALFARSSNNIQDLV